MSEFDDRKMSWQGLLDAMLKGDDAEPKQLMVKVHDLRMSVYGSKEAQLEVAVTTEEGVPLVSYGKYWVQAGASLNLGDIHRSFVIRVE